MDEESEIVAAKIESGEYFREGLSWFHSKFTGPRTEFSYVLIICVLSLLTFIIGVFSFAEIFPLAPGANFYMSRSLEPGEHITIKGLKGSKSEPNNALLTFLLADYVKAHEEYLEAHIDRNTRFIYTFSSNDIYKEFLSALSTDNPQSPLLLYGQQANKVIKTDEVKLFDATGKPATELNAAKATVKFRTSLIFVDQDTEENTNHQADISFQYKEIIVDQKTGAIKQKPELVVTSYTTKILQNPQ